MKLSRLMIEHNEEEIGKIFYVACDRIISIELATNDLKFQSE